MISATNAPTTVPSPVAARITSDLKAAVSRTDLVLASVRGGRGYVRNTKAAMTAASQAIAGAKSLGWSGATSSTVRNAGHGLRGLSKALELSKFPTVYGPDRVAAELTEARNRLKGAIVDVQVDLRHAHKAPSYGGEPSDDGSYGGGVHGETWDPITGQEPRASYNEYGEVVYSEGSGEFSSTTDWEG